jgi:nucleoside-diphosphate-sugar epimerase
MGLPLIAVTGATGFIGRRISRALVDCGYNVRALARRIPSGGPGQAEVTWIEGSLSDRDALARLVKDSVAVVHCAGATKAGNRAAFLEINGEGTRLLAEAAALCPNPPRFVLISSLAAREPRLSAYAASKRVGEQFLRTFPQLPSVVLRPPAVYGPGDMEILKIFQMAARGFVPAPMVADARVSLVHVDDVAGAVVAALKLDDLPNRPIEFDDGTPGAHTWAEIAAAAGAAVRTTPFVLPIPAFVLYLAGAAASLSTALTKRPMVLCWGKVPELLHPDWVAARAPFPGYKPLWNIEKGFKDAVSWYTSQGLLTT